MSGLPTGWARVPLSQLIELNPKNAGKPDLDAAFMPMPHLGTSYRSRPTFEVKPWGQIGKSYVHFAEGDVLLAKITPCFENGKAGIPEGLPNGIGAGSSEYFVCRTRDEVLLPRWLLAYFKTEQFLRDGAKLMTGSVGHKRVPKDYVLGAELPLPPSAEQRRIVDKLDATLARIDACRERLNRTRALMTRFRQSVLAAATSGRLTEEQRAQHAWPQWQQATIGEVAVDVRYGTSKRCDYGVDGLGVLRIPNIEEDGSISVKDLKFAEFDAKEIEKLSLCPGDLLVIRSNGSVDLVGRAAVVSAAQAGLLFAGYLMRLRPDQTRILPTFAYLVLAAPEQRRLIERTCKSTSGVNNLNAEELRSLPIRLPSLAEQNSIVRRVAALMSWADRMEARLDGATSAAVRLSPATLAKAFRGELVSQDPAEEPADTLLARLRPDGNSLSPPSRRRGRLPAA